MIFLVYNWTTTATFGKKCSSPSIYSNSFSETHVNETRESIEYMGSQITSWKSMSIIPKTQYANSRRRRIHISLSPPTPHLAAGTHITSSLRSFDSYIHRRFAATRIHQDRKWWSSSPLHPIPSRSSLAWESEVTLLLYVYVHVRLEKREPRSRWLIAATPRWASCNFGISDLRVTRDIKKNCQLRSCFHEDLRCYSEKMHTFFIDNKQKSGKCWFIYVNVCYNQR